MNDFRRSGRILHTLPFEARVLYSAFLVFLLLGYFTMAWLYVDSMGAGVASYYRGDAAGMAFEKSPRQMLEVFHFHLFTVPVVLLIIAHLYVLSRDGDRRKAVCVVTGFAAAFAHILAPLGVRFVSASLAPLMPLSGALMTAAVLYMTAYPLFDMWRKPPAQSA